MITIHEGVRANGDDDVRHSEVRVPR